MTKLPKPITDPPDEEELASRLNNVRKLMNKQNLDYYISFDPTNIYYLTNFANYVHERPFILIIPIKGTLKFLVPYLEVNHVKSRARCNLEIHDYFEYPAPIGQNWFDKYRKIIPNDARVGVESAITLRVYDNTPGKRIKTDIIDEVRMIKTEYEIGRLVHACKIINAGHKKLLKIVKPGMMLFQIHSQLTKDMTGKVVAAMPNLNPMVSKIDAAVLPPSISYDPHNFTDIFLKMEEGGPHVSGIGGQINGYGVEIERTFFLGYVPENAREPFNVMMEARTVAYGLAKPGANMGEIDDEVKRILKKQGYADKILHRTGHGLGITGHEAPFLASGYNRELKSGMVISIEPGIYIPELGGFRHSDTVLITDEGNISLTKAPIELEDLTLEIK